MTPTHDFTRVSCPHLITPNSKGFTLLFRCRPPIAKQGYWLDVSSMELSLPPPCCVVGPVDLVIEGRVTRYREGWGNCVKPGLH